MSALITIFIGFSVGLITSYFIWKEELFSIAKMETTKSNKSPFTKSFLKKEKLIPFKK